jgi:hypothetical protein
MPNSYLDMMGARHELSETDIDTPVYLAFPHWRVGGLALMQRLGLEYDRTLETEEFPGPLHGVNYYGRPQMTARLRHAVLLRDSRTCRYCGRGPLSNRELHVDHVVARVKGGDHSMSNLATACASCNLSKNAHNVEEWLNRPGRATNDP